MTGDFKNFEKNPFFCDSPKIILIKPVCAAATNEVIYQFVRTKKKIFVIF